jgi:hypothetical protein
MIEFQKNNDGVILQYSPEFGSEWIYKQLADSGSFSLRRTFFLETVHLYGSSKVDEPDYDSPVEFKVARKAGDYFEFDMEILNIEYRLYIHKDIDLTYRTFIAEKKVSVFSIINELKPSKIYIGGEHQDSLPKEEFQSLIKNFPNTYELRKYVVGRLSAVLRNYFEINIDGEKQYHQYMNKKISKVGDDITGTFKESEILKFTTILEKLEGMLKDENSYSEKQWQLEILQIILLLHPKYIHVFKEAPVRDTYNKKNRSLDFLLVDSTGNTDIIEIKRPFDKCIVTSNQYRNNYIPLRELSGTVMQIEKYIFYLNKWGKKGEEVLTKKYKDELPKGFSIKITNPGGIIIMGRENNLSPSQKQDFEVIKRKYKNVLDIITYDDLLGRIKFTIEQLKKNT